jgi:hypothetical protein
MFGALDPLADGQQGGELVACPGRIPRQSVPQIRGGATVMDQVFGDEDDQDG